MSKTQITLAIAIVIAIANALVPFLPADVQAGVTTLLGALAFIFHTKDVNNAVAQASAPAPKA